MFDLTDRIISYEEGDTTPEEDVELFSHLIKTGQAWSLQGHYGRTAMAYIKAGIIRPDGSIGSVEAN